MVKVRRGLQRLSDPTTLLKQGHLKKVVQDCVHVSFEDPQGMRLHNPYGQAVQLLSHMHSEEVMSRQNLLCSILHLLPLVLALGTTEKSMVLFSFASSLQVFSGTYSGNY